MEYEVALTRIIDLAPGVKSFRFTVPAGFKFEAGHFFYVKLSDKLMKHFSFSNSPTEKGYLEFTTRMSGSEYKNILDSLKEGARMKIQGPYGSFTYDKALSKLAFLSGGIGITPIRSMCKYILDKGIDCDIVLIYGNDKEENVAFGEDFDEMAGKSKKLRVVHVLSNPPAGWRGRTGFITKDIVLNEVPDYKERTFYVCGPPAMVLAMTKILDELQVEKSRIKLENFVGY